MDYHFIVQSLNQLGQSDLIEAISHKTYPRTFVLPSHIISRIPISNAENTAISPGLDKLIKCHTSHAFNNDGWLPESGTYTVVIQEQIKNQVDFFIRRVCDHNAQFSGKDAILFIEAALFRYLHDHRENSVLAIEPYLVWDNGVKNWPDQVDTDSDRKLLWSGAGSISLVQRKWLQQNAPGSNCDNDCLSANYVGMRTELNQRAEKLVAAHDAMETSKKLDTWIQPSLRVAHHLLRYLPPKQKNGVLVRYGSNVTTGMLPFHGPIPWRGWRDDLLDDLERDMVFESWLVPFQNPITDQWSLQPGSLLLLYWAFDVVGIEPGLSPQDFINQHEWQGWFGERMRTYEQQ